MAVISPLKRKYAEGSASLSFSPRSGTAMIVKKIGIKTTSKDFVKITSGNTTVAFYEVGPDARTHLQMPLLNEYRWNLMTYLQQKGIDTTIPVAEGDVFSISLSNAADIIMVEYQEVEPGDITADMWNAPGSPKQVLLLYGTNADARTDSDFKALDKCLNPPEMHAWPFEEVACPFDTIRVHGIGALNVSENYFPGGVDAYSSTRLLRLWRGRERLFFEEYDGFVIESPNAAAESQNVIYGQGDCEVPYNPIQAGKDMFFLPEPLVFNKGEELRVEIKLHTNTNAQLDAEELRAVLICTIE